MFYNKYNCDPKATLVFFPSNHPAKPKRKAEKIKIHTKGRPPAPEGMQASNYTRAAERPKGWCPARVAEMMGPCGRRCHTAAGADEGGQRT